MKAVITAGGFRTRLTVSSGSRSSAARVAGESVQLRERLRPRRDAWVAAIAEADRPCSEAPTWTDEGRARMLVVEFPGPIAAWGKEAA